jgi:hypothetical protein
VELELSHIAVGILAAPRSVELNRVENRPAAVGQDGLLAAAVVGCSPVVAHRHKRPAETCCQIYDQKWAETALDSHIRSVRAGHILAEDSFEVADRLAVERSLVVADSEGHSPVAGMWVPVSIRILEPAEPSIERSNKPLKRPP